MSRDDHHEAAAATATIESTRAYLRGEYKDPLPGTLAHEIEQHMLAAWERSFGLRMLITFVIVFLAGILLLALTSPAHAGERKADVMQSPAGGLYIDQTMPARYCVIQTGRFGWFGRQTFVFCAAGYNNAGSTFVAPAPAIGQEYLLYRLQADGGLMAPTVVNSVTIDSATHDAIVIRFGSPGAQAGPYTLTREPCQPEPPPTIYLNAPRGREGCGG